MRITADTNLFVRLVLGDHPLQKAAARAVIDAATLVAVPLPVLCELAWVLGKLGARRTSLADTIEGVLRSANVRTDRIAAEAGLASLRAGGDFADGVIAEAGAGLGGALFVSFDARAVALRVAQGGRAATPDAVSLQP